MAEILTLVPLPLLIAFLAFLAMFYVVSLFSGDPRETMRATVETYSRNPEQAELGRAVPVGGFGERVALPLLDALASALSRAAPQEMRAQTAQMLTMAGNPLGVSTFLALKMVCLFALPLVYVAAILRSGQPWALQQLAILVVIVGIGRMLPNMLLNMRIRARQKKIERSIPDAVDLIVACVEGGLSLDAALMKVADRMAGPLTEEIARALQEINLGMPRRDALKGMAARTGVQSLQTFSQSIAQAEQMGISIADVLRTLGDQLRTRRRLKAQEMAQKAPVKMIPVVIVFILPALMTVVTGPAMITIMGFFAK